MRQMGGSRNAAGVAESGHRRWRVGNLRGNTRGAARAGNMGAGARNATRPRRFRTSHLIGFSISSAGADALRKKKILRAERNSWARLRRPQIASRISTNASPRASEFPQMDKRPALIRMEVTAILNVLAPGVLPKLASPQRETGRHYSIARWPSIYSSYDRRRGERISRPT